MFIPRAELSPKGLPPKVIMGLAIGLPIAAILFIVMGVVHYISKRHSRKLEEKRNIRAWPQQIAHRRVRRFPTVTVTAPTPELPGSSPVGAPLGRAWSQPARAPIQIHPGSVAEMPAEMPESLIPGRYATVGHGHVKNGGRGLQSAPTQAYDPVSRRTIYLG